MIDVSCLRSCPSYRWLNLASSDWLDALLLPVVLPANNLLGWRICSPKRHYRPIGSIRKPLNLSSCAGRRKTSLWDWESISDNARQALFVLITERFSMDECRTSSSYFFPALHGYALSPPLTPPTICPFLSTPPPPPRRPFLLTSLNLAC